MSSSFCLAFRLLGSAFHGRNDANDREWPPSPLRVYQSLVAAAARVERGELSDGTRAAFKWLERQPPPTIVCPESIEGVGYCLSVPNNAMDIVAKAWCRGNYSDSGDASPATHRTMKAVSPMLLADGAVMFMWPIPEPCTDEIREHIQALSGIARSVVALGWGIDVAICHGSLLNGTGIERMKGERWQPAADARNGGLRVPIGGTLEDLMYRHERFLARLGPAGFIPPPPVSAYRKIGYRRASDPPRSSVAVFSLLKPDASGLRAFDPARKGLTVAGMVRGAAKLAAQRSGWPAAKINAFILGHADSNGGAKHVAVGPARFAYLPLPSIEGRGAGKSRVVGSVRRVMVSCSTDGCEDEIGWARRMLSGQELIDEDTKTSVALLSVIPSNDSVVRCYTRSATRWATVTPVVLPGYDDPEHLRRRMKAGKLSSEQQRRILQRLSDRIDGLLRKAIVHAGFSEELADHANLEWRKVGFWSGTDLADRYGVPDHLKRFPRFHVRIQWRNEQNEPIEIPGPICFGGGRFYGVGVFAPL
jgi:CRISPR-associated protein Csb2